MNKLDQYYLQALSETLKGNLGEALELRNEADALASDGFQFSENCENKYPFIEEAVNTLLGSYDFTRCVRPDGTAYGTGGKCKKGTEEAKDIKNSSREKQRRKNKPILIDVGTKKNPWMVKTSVWNSTDKSFFVPGYSPSDFNVFHKGHYYSHTGVTATNIKTGEPSKQFQAEKLEQLIQQFLNVN